MNSVNILIGVICIVYAIGYILSKCNKKDTYKDEIVSMYLESKGSHKTNPFNVKSDEW